MCISLQIPASARALLLRFAGILAAVHGLRAFEV